MKKTLTLGVFILSFLNLLAQKESLLTDCKQATQRYDLETNSLISAILNGGDMFWDLQNSKFGLKARTGQPFVGTIFAGGLWLGGKTTSGELKLAASTYRNSTNTDYWAGPLQNGVTEFDICKKWDKQWAVSRKDIDNHVSQTRNGTITDTVASVFSWPGKNNPYFTRFNGFDLPQNRVFAPFFDKNGDGNYTPQLGDYPLPENVVANAVPDMAVWCIFNDAGGVHTSSRSVAIAAEIHQTVWAYKTNNLIDSCVFTSHKVINKGTTALDSFYIGHWVDFDLGCYTDDFLGSLPSKNTFYVYNRNAVDAINCVNNIRGFGANPPVQAVTFLNKPLSKFTTHFNEAVGMPPSAISTPLLASEYYGHLAGRWRDGTKLTRGNLGYNLLSNDTVSHAYAGLPYDTTGWSMYQTNRRSVIPEYDILSLGSTYIGRFNILDTARLDVVYSLHQSLNGNNIDNVYTMVDNLPKITNVYQQQFLPLARTVSTQDMENDNTIQVYPNPTSGKIVVQSKKMQMERIEMYNTVGQLMQIYPNIKSFLFEIGTQNVSNGLYFLKIYTENKTKTEKILVKH
jgi:Secretion system C-terminal sorting domain